MNLDHLFENNRKWAAAMEEGNRGFFEKLAKQQAPHYLWIGCSDSRVPANEIIGLMPGDVFVHRNVGNIVYHNDMNVLSVIQFAVKHLNIKDIIVCGHYGCGGVSASIANKRNGLIDNWLRKIQDVYQLHEAKFEGLGEEEKANLLCEMNVIEQAKTIARTVVVNEHWEDGGELTIHGMVYSLKDGLLQSLGKPLTRADDLKG
jgi:carbonic anhydrase